VTARDRHLDWEGCFNVRELGGLPAAGGRTTSWGGLVRADALDGLTAAGWAALVEHGVRTVVDLRNDDELSKDAAPRPREVTTVRIPLDVTEDRELWNVWQNGPQFGTPLYYRPYGRTSGGVKRTTFVIDEVGVVQQVFPGVKPAEHDELVLTALGAAAS